MIRELRDRGVTVVLTTHAMDEAEHLCDRVGIIDHGRLVACDSPVELTARAAADETTFSAVARPRRRRARRRARPPRAADVRELRPGDYLVDGDRDARAGRRAHRVALRPGRAAERAAGRAPYARRRVPAAHQRGAAREGQGGRRAQTRIEMLLTVRRGESLLVTHGDPARHPGVLLQGRRGQHHLQGPGRLPRARGARARGDVERDGEPRDRHRLRAPLRRAEAARVRRRSRAPGCSAPRRSTCSRSSSSRPLVIVGHRHRARLEHVGPGSCRGRSCSSSARSRSRASACSWPGTLRAEANLAVANGLFLVLLFLGGMAYPLAKLPDAVAGRSPRRCRRRRCRRRVRGGAHRRHVVPGRRARGAGGLGDRRAVGRATRWFRWEE